MKLTHKSKLYSQNELKSENLVKKLISGTSINSNDVVVDIGAGSGIITRQLIDVAGEVIAVEIDSKLSSHLTEAFSTTGNVVVIASDYLKYEHPAFPFKVFANIPFRHTSDFIRKLVGDENFKEGYLIIQKEAAQKFVGIPYAKRNSMMAILLRPWFEMSIYHNFERSDFSPMPNVDSVMLRIKKRDKPLVSDQDKKLYEDYIYYLFNKERVATVPFNEILQRFNKFKTSKHNDKLAVARVASAIREKQKDIQKIKRTRLDRNWKRFKS